MLNNRKLSLLAIISLISFVFPLTAQAVCPICTIAVGACVGLSRYFGVDDTITGAWIGGLIVSLIIWTINWLDRKNIKFRGRKILTVLVFYIFALGPLYYTGIIGHPFNRLWGLDKLILGVLLGSIVFILGVWLHLKLKKRNNNQSYFPFQKVVLPIIPLIALSIVFYYLTC